ncbi:MAG: transcription termination/antitermination protein NusA [Clostridia bacterium]|nr:transcription termination/antitermination protein NusA [Clostridia bacterium]MBR2290119.1 transcription termination/antitermination protein NusA [Clostridia bacterium]
MNKEFFDALEALSIEKGISKDYLLDAIENALVIAYKRNFNSSENVKIVVDEETSQIRVYSLKEVVEEVFDPVIEISLEEARLVDKKAKMGDFVEIEVTPKDFGRISAQTAKQVIAQKIREAEREIIFSEYSDRQGEIVSGIVQKVDKNLVIVDLGRIEGIMTQNEQMPNETYEVNDRVKAYVVEVQKSSKGVPQMLISRTHPGFVKRLLELEIPEIYEGLIEIKNIVREAGSRTKIAVYSKDPNIDPVGSCVGPRGTRIQGILNELKDEKIDVVEWSEDPVQFIASALSPATVLAVDIDEENKASKVVVPDGQLSLAIGKDGQNARLSAKLTGWKIDIKSESQIKAGE